VVVLVVSRDCDTVGYTDAVMSIDAVGARCDVGVSNEEFVSVGFILSVDVAVREAVDVTVCVSDRVDSFVWDNVSDGESVAVDDDVCSLDRV